MPPNTNTPSPIQNEPSNSPSELGTPAQPLQTEVETPNQKKPSKVKNIFSTALLVMSALVFALLLQTFVFQSYEVDGSSMEPTLQNRDRLIIWKLPRTWAKVTGNEYVPQRGDIVVFHKPDGSDEQLIKRVIGLPGERVVVADEKITVYNSEHPEGFNPDDASYGEKLEPTYGNVDVIVGESEIFVSGDNRIPGASLDSRSSLGNVPLNKIVGVLALRIFPLK